MNAILKSIFILCLFSAPFLSSCGKDDPETCDYATELQVELDAVIAAGQTFGQNPTTANCLAYVASLNAYLDAAEDFRTCAANAGQGAEFQAAIDQQQAAVDAIQC